MSSIYLLFGSNLGNRVTNINQAIEKCINIGLKCEKISHFYETAPWGVQEQPTFYNVAAKFEKHTDPERLLVDLKKIEVSLGRQKREQWTAREIDIDILYFGKDVINSNLLTVPHPFLIKRRFALEPLNEIAPKKNHPQLRLNSKQLLQLCTDTANVIKLKMTPKIN